jgi:hypothetical protein
MNKYVVYLYNEVIQSLKEWDIHSCYNMNLENIILNLSKIQKATISVFSTEIKPIEFILES